MLKIGNLWLVILGAAILGYCLFVFNQLSNRANSAEIALANYQHAHAELVLKQRIENSIKFSNAQNAVNAEKEKSLKLLLDLQIDRAKTAKKIKEQYDIKVDSIKRNLVDRTSGVLPATDSNASATTETSSNPKEFAGSESDCHAANFRLQSQYSTLEDSCAITTADYNQLRAWGDSVCELAVCE